MPQQTAAEYSPGEEIASVATHGLGVVLSGAGCALLIVFASLYGDAWHVVSAAIYGVTLVVLYAASTVYHAVHVSSPRAKRVAQLVDHSAIYLLIAGTYTPFTLVTLRGPWGWSLFGIDLEPRRRRRRGRVRSGRTGRGLPRRWSTSPWAGSSWSRIRPLIGDAARPGLWLLFGGGLIYTIGTSSTCSRSATCTPSGTSSCSAAASAISSRSSSTCVPGRP